LFILGLSVYIYVPIAASRNPPINWDNAVNLKNFLHLLLRTDYGGITYTGKNIPVMVRIINVIHYLKTLVSTFSYQILFVFLLGIIKLIKIDKRLALTMMLAFLFTGALTFFYTAGPITVDVAWGIAERYYSVSTIILMFVVPYGFLIIKDFLNSKFSKPIYSNIILSYFLIISLLLFRYNFPKTDLSKTQIGNTFARNIFSSLPKNSVLFVSGDNATFSIWYLYYVLKEGQDLDIINPSGVGNNIYLDKELNDYYAKNPQVELKNLVVKTFEAIRKKRRVFTLAEISPIPKGTKLIPKGLVLELVSDQDLPSEEEYLIDIEKIWQAVKVQRRETLSLAEDNFLASEIPSIYARALVQIGDFIRVQYGDSKTAEAYYKKAVWIDNMFSPAYFGLAISLISENKNCNEAIKNIKIAISIYPTWKQYYYQQYQIYKKCFADKKILDNLRQEYRINFGNNMQ
ncbi:MAG: hypothetical protein V1858_00445, partial [Candidatus Gottesmanbacteria bacterium]